MKCPLTYTAVQSRPEEFRLEAVECILTDCARFDEYTGVCSDVAEVRVLTAIGNVLGRIHDELKELIDK